MATQNIVAGGGRSSGGSVVSPTEAAKQIADNSAVSSSGAQSSEDFVLPPLDAAVVDQLFREAQEAAGTREVNRETGETVTTTFNGSLGAGPGKEGFNSPNSPYAKMGWDLGWNAVGSNISQGIAAFGLKTAPVNYSDSVEGMFLPTGSKYTNLLDIAKFADVDPAAYKNPDGTLNEDSLKSAVDTALKDYYHVSGDTGGLPGSTNPTPGKFVSSYYRREGDKLVPVSGTARTFMAPENSAGHFADYLAPVASILAAPIFSGLGVLGQAGSLTTAISGATGLSPFWANILGTGVVRGGLSAASGGSFGKGALGGALTAGVSPLISQGAGELAGPGTTGASLLTGAGNLGLQAILNGGNVTPMGAVSALLSGFGKGRNTGRQR